MAWPCAKCNELQSIIDTQAEQIAAFTASASATAQNAAAAEEETDGGVHDVLEESETPSPTKK